MRTTRQLTPLLVLAILIANSSSAQTRAGLRPPSNLLEAIIGIGRDSNVSMGVQLLGTALIDHAAPAEIKDRGSVEATVRSLLADVPRYCVETRGKILSVHPCDRRRATWLDFRLRRFTAHADQLQSMSWALSSWLKAEVHPTKGIMGHFRMGNPSNIVGPYDKSNASVRTLLDQFVADSHGATWITMRPYGHRAVNDEPDHFWFIAEYDHESLMLSVTPQVRFGFIGIEK